MAENMKSFIKEKVRKRINGYRNENELITSEYARENELGRAYKGREILELIQNAEDELTDDQPKEIYISFDGSVLSVANYGEPFSEEGITSLMYSNTSNKKNRKKKVIGNKGTGFRAILGWAEEIEINSADLHIKFSHKHAQDVLKNEVFKDSTVPKGKKAATLVFPEWLDEYEDTGYTTEISLRIKKNEAVAEDIRRQLRELNGNLLLFLNRTEKITVDLEGSISCFSKKIVSSNKVELTKIEDGESVYSKEWILNKKDGLFGDENYSIVIAYDMEGNKPDDPRLYTYFQTDVRFPFSVLLHADFNLNGDRNHLVKDNPANKQILEDAAELMVDTAIKIYDKGVSYNRMLFLIPDDKLEIELERYGFMDMLKTKMKEAEIFPTVNSKYVMYSPSLKFYTSGLAKYLSGGEFSDLLMYSDYTEIDSLLKEFGYLQYTFVDVSKRITHWIENKRKITDENIRHIAYTAIQYVDEFERTYEFRNNPEKYPPFFFNKDRKLIPQGTSIFLIDENYEVTKPPIFANIEFMDPYMRDYFYKKLRDEDELDSDVIIEKLGALNVREYNSVELMDHINNVLESKLEEGKTKDAKDRWKTLIKWLWTNRGLFINESETINTFFLTRKNGLEYSNSLYYGIEYDNKLCEDLIGSVAANHMVCDLKKYIECDNSEELTTFLRLFGIADLPRMKVTRYHEITGYYNRDACSPYIRKMFSFLKYPVTLENTDVFNDLNDFCKRVFEVFVQRTEIDLLDNILAKSSTKSIIRWIQSDSRLQNHLYTGFENSVMSVQVIWDDRRTARPLATMKRPYSYIYHLFATIPWIEVDGARYSISDCLLGFDSHGVDLSAFLVEPDISEYIKDVDGPKGKIKKDYQNIFEKLQVKREFADLPFSKIYGVLNYLPSVEGSEELARGLYNSIIDKADLEITDEDLGCKEYKSYLSNGLILTNNGYKPVSESYYLDGKDVCEKVAKTYNLISVPKKRSKARIKKLFGVDQLVLIGHIVGTPIVHPENGIFASDFNQFKIMAFAYRIGSVSDKRREARRFRDITVTICTEIRAEYGTEKDEDFQEIELDDYEYILEGDDKYFLKVPELIEYKDMKHNMLLASAVANIFSSYLDVSEIVSKFRELYYVGNNDERRELIEQEYDDDSLISKSKELLSLNEDVKDEFVEILTKLSGKAETNFKKYADDIDFEDFTADYNVKHIIDALKFAGINVSDYNAEVPSVAIDLVPYFDREVQGQLPFFREKYKTTWYSKLQKASLADKLNLVSNFLLFDSSTVRVENDIYFNVKKAIVSQLEIDDNIEVVDLVALYKTNFAKWREKQIDLRFVDEFVTRPENMSLIYYGEFDELTNRYRAYCAEYSGDEVTEEIPDSRVEERRVPEVYLAEAHPVKPAKKRTHARTTTGFVQRAPKRELERVGLLGEQLVYEILLNDDSVSHVEWVSENAKKVGINPEGGAGCGYDIEFVDADGRRKYVEVKSSKSSKDKGICFYMSDFEFEFGRKHADDYLLYYVSEASSRHPQVLVFKNVFKNHDFNKKNFSIEVSSEYTITAQAEI